MVQICKILYSQTLAICTTEHYRIYQPYTISEYKSQSNISVHKGYFKPKKKKKKKNNCHL